MVSAVCACQNLVVWNLSLAWLSLAFGKVRSKLPYLGIKFGVVSELSSLKLELGLAELGFWQGKVKAPLFGD